MRGKGLKPMSPEAEAPRCFSAPSTWEVESALRGLGFGLLVVSRE